MVALMLAGANAGAGEDTVYSVTIKVIETEAISSKADGSRTTTTCTDDGAGNFTCDSKRLPEAQHIDLVSLADLSDGRQYMLACIQRTGARFAQGFAAGAGAATVTGCAVPPGTYKGRWDRGRLKLLHEKGGKSKETTFIVLSSTPAQVRQNGTSSQQTRLSLSSTPPGADIAIDGVFVGQTPSAIPVLSGEHFLKTSKPGYKQWERRINTSGGEVTIATDLELETK